MMSTTHAAMGLTGAVLLIPFSPELAVVAALGAFAGGIFPDIDVVFEHRKTFHHPELYPVLAGVSSVLAVLSPGPWTVGVAAFLASAALHSLVDVFGGGLSRRPWLVDDHRGIYLHLSGRWIPPKRWVRYDGSPEDLLVAVGFSIPPLVAFDGLVQQATIAGLVVSLAYVLLRKRLVDVYEAVLE